MFTTNILRIDSKRLFLKEKAKDIPSLIFDDKYFLIGMNANFYNGTIPGNLMLLTSKKGKLMFTRNEKDADKFGKSDPVINRLVILAQDKFAEYDLFKSLMIGNLDDLKKVLKYILKGSGGQQIDDRKELSLTTFEVLQQKLNGLSLTIDNHLSDIESQLSQYKVKYFPSEKKQSSHLAKLFSIEHKLLRGLKANFKKNIDNIEEHWIIKSTERDKYHLDIKLAEFIYGLVEEERYTLRYILKRYNMLYAFDFRALFGPLYNSIITNKFKWLSKVKFDESFENMVIAYEALNSKVKKEIEKQKPVDMLVWSKADFDMHNIIEKVNAVKNVFGQLVICQADFLAALLKQRTVPNNSMLKVIGCDDDKWLVKKVLNAIDYRLPLNLN